RRLGVTLLTTNRDVTRLALDVAIQLGVARAGSVARIQALSARLADAEDLVSLVALVSGELGGVRVRVVSTGGVAIAEAGGSSAPTRPALSPGEHVTPVTVRVSRRGSEADVLVADVTEHAGSFTEHVLLAAVPAIRALLSETRLRAIRASLPMVTMTALTGTSRVGGYDDPFDLGAAAALTWPLDGSHMALCILSNDPGRLGGAVHQLWNAEVPEVPLGRFTDGWLAFVPLRDEDSQQLIIDRLREQLEQLCVLGLMVGVSPIFSGSAAAPNSVRKAWLAARLAGTDGASDDALVVFDDIRSHLLHRLLPPELAEQVANEIFPLLLTDAASGEIIETLLAYLSARGSISHTASALGVHRNTVQSRLRRAEELGVALNDPGEILPAHMILAALARRRGAPRVPGRA
ncbi:PucR family transcriptional regulator, partial [Microterricola pindariensis]